MKRRLSVMSETWVFIAGKGGPGKTTSIINMGAYLVKSGYRVKFIDCDPQHSLVHFGEDGGCDLFSISYMAPNQIRKNLKKESKGYDYVLIDTRGSTGEEMGAPLGVSDVAIVPVQSTKMDRNAMHTTVDLINRVNDIRGDEIKVFYLVTQVRKNTKSERNAKQKLIDMYEDPNDCPHILSSYISRREIYHESAGIGLSVFETEDDKAKEEYANAVNEILEVMKNG